MKVKALRGVCIGVGSHLAAGDTADLEPALVTFLVGIGAVAVEFDEPLKLDSAAAEPQPTTTPKGPEPAVTQDTKDPPPAHTPGKSGKKEK